MALVVHTPNPAQGAIIDAFDAGLGRIIVPDDNELVNGNIGRAPAEQLADWVAFLVKGPANDIDYKITGNGTPPVGGYTPTTRPIEIKGTGLQMTGPTVRSGTAAKSTGRAATNIGAAATLATVDTTSDTWYVDNPSWAVNVDYVVANAGGSAPGDALTIVAWGLTSGGTIRIRRSAPPGGIIMLSISGTGMGWGTFLKVGSSWRLLSFGGDATLTPGTP